MQLTLTLVLALLFSSNGFSQYAYRIVPVISLPVTCEPNNGEVVILTGAVPPIVPPGYIFPGLYICSARNTWKPIGPLKGPNSAGAAQFESSFIDCLNGSCGLYFNKNGANVTDSPSIQWSISDVPLWALGMDIANRDQVLLFDFSLPGDVLRFSNTADGGFTKMIFGQGIGSPVAFPYQFTLDYSLPPATPNINGMTVQNGTAGIRLDILQSNNSNAFGTAGFTGGAIGMRANQSLMFGTNNIERLRISNTGELQLSPRTFATLGTPVDGSLLYCSDCTVSAPCAGGGTGALAKRLNGVWICN